MLPENSLTPAGALAERIRLAIEETAVSTQQGQISCTVSIGVACWSE